MIIEFNRRNTVYPERQKAKTRDRGRGECCREVEGDDLGTGRRKKWESWRDGAKVRGAGRQKDAGMEGWFRGGEGKRLRQ